MSELRRALDALIVWFPLLICTPYFYSSSLDQAMVLAYGSGTLLAPLSLLCFSVLLRQNSGTLMLFLLLGTGTLALVFQGFFLQYTMNNNKISITAITVIVVLYTAIAIWRTYGLLTKADIEISLED